MLVIGKNWYASLFYEFRQQDDGHLVASIESEEMFVKFVVGQDDAIDPRALIESSDIRHAGLVTLVPWSTATEKLLRFYSNASSSATLPGYCNYRQGDDNFNAVLFPNQNIANVGELEKIPDMTLLDNLTLSLPLMNPSIKKVAGMDVASYLTLSYELPLERAVGKVARQHSLEHLDIELRCHNMYSVVISRHVMRALPDDFPRGRIDRNSIETYVKEYARELSENHDIRTYLHRKN
jgi:hypothetical protein